MIGVKRAEGMWFTSIKKLLTSLCADPREDSPNTESTEEPGQEPNQNDEREDSNTDRSTDEDGVLQPQDIEVEGELTNLQRWLGLKEYIPQVIGQCLAV